jgi:hypothetical protein
MIITREILQNLYNQYYETDHSLLSKHNTHVHYSKGKHTSLLLDELNRAPLDIRQAALQLILSKQIHQHTLPYFKGIPAMVTACINPEDGYQVEAMDPALLDRFLTLNVTVDANAWLKWAENHDVLKVIRSFIRDNPDKLHWSSVEVQDSKYPTPRAWTKLSDVLKNIPNAKKNPLTLDLIKGKIGESIGTRFYTYFCKFDEQITSDDIQAYVENHESEDPEIIGNDLRKSLLKSMDVLNKSELTEFFIKTQIVKNATVSSALTALSMLWCVELETRGSILSNLKENHLDVFKIFLNLDTDRKITKSITSLILKGRES